MIKTVKTLTLGIVLSMGFLLNFILITWLSASVLTSVFKAGSGKCHEKWEIQNHSVETQLFCP
jgi:hypothetical protein